MHPHTPTDQLTSCIHDVAEITVSRPTLLVNADIWFTTVRVVTRAGTVFTLSLHGRTDDDVDAVMSERDAWCLPQHIGDDDPIGVDIPPPGCTHCGEPGSDFIDMNGNPWHALCHRDFVREYNEYYDQIDDRDVPPAAACDGTDARPDPVRTDRRDAF